MDENGGRNALVIVPTYNERENLPVLVSRVMELPGFRLLIVDDQSPDGTGAIADSLAERYPPGRVTVLHRQGERGLGNSYVDGFPPQRYRRMLNSSARWTPICPTTRLTYPIWFPPHLSLIWLSIAVRLWR